MKRLKKVAAMDGWKIIDSFVLKSGDLISFNISIISNRVWFQIAHESDFSVSSYYDGYDKDRAIHYYTEVLLAFKGVQAAELFNKNQVPQIDNFINVLKENVRSESNVLPLKQQPLFLGMNNF